VLVVEDELLIAMELDAVLQEAGFTVVGPVSSVGEALDAIQAEHLDAAVLDVSLYGQRVTPVAEVLLSINTPFVLTSAYQSCACVGDRPGGSHEPREANVPGRTSQSVAPDRDRPFGIRPVFVDARHSHRGGNRSLRNIAFARVVEGPTFHL
jgi:CheY-like chemotaxis protein